MAAASCSSDDGASVSPSAATEATEAAAMAGGTVFTDPQGGYELRVPDDWGEKQSALTAEIELWFVAEAEEGFRPNVNVLTQDAQGLSLSEYLETSTQNGPLIFEDFELLDSSIIEGAKGQPLAMMEYTGNGLQYVAVFALTPEGQAIVATLTAPPDRYDEIRADAFPSLLTLKPI